MSRTQGLLTTAVHGGRWGMPWLAALATSTALAYAMTAALATSAPRADDAATSVAVAQLPVYAVPPWEPASRSLVGPDVDPSAATSAVASTPTAPAVARFSDEPCGRSGSGLMYVGLGTYVRTEPKQASCPEDAP
jgi:hypothetical protein